MMFRFALIIPLFALTGCMTPEEPRLSIDERQQAQGAKKVAECIASECTRLDLDGTQLADFTVLNDMPHVTALMVSYSNFEDLSQIAGMTQLKELHIGFTDVKDLSGLSAFANLDLLHAHYLAEGANHAPIYAMRGLKELSISPQTGDGLGFVRNMRNLESLFFMGGEVTDMSPLAGNRTVKELAIESQTPDDLSAIAQMRNLRMLKIEAYILDDDLKTALENKGVTLELEYGAIAC